MADEITTIPVNELAEQTEAPDENMIMLLHKTNSPVATRWMKFTNISGWILTNGSIGTPMIATGAVTQSKIANAAVNNDKLAQDAVRTVHILDENVTEGKIATGAITHSKIAAGAIRNAKIEDGAVNSAKIENGAIVMEKLADDAVETDKILDGAVTVNKLADGIAMFMYKSNSDDARGSETGLTPPKYYEDILYIHTLPYDKAVLPVILVEQKSETTVYIKEYGIEASRNELNIVVASCISLRDITVEPNYTLVILVQ